MGFNPKINSRIKALANKKESELEELSIYLSSTTAKHLSELAKTITGKNLSVNIVISNGFTAFTDGDRVVINCQSDCFRRYSTPEERWIAFMGIFYHELAHAVFTDFNRESEIIENMQKGTFYGGEPRTCCPADEAALQEMKDAMQNPDYGPIFSQVFHDLDNIIIDRHDEDCLMERYHGMVPAGIMKARESLLYDAGLFEDMESKIKAGELSELYGFYNCLLTYSRFGDIPMNEDLWESSEVLKSLSLCQKDVDLACWTDDITEKFTAINNISLSIWKYIKKELERVQEQQNQDENSAQNPNSQQMPNSSQISQALGDVLKQLQKASSNVGQTPVPQNQISSAKQVNGHSSGNSPAGVGAQITQSSAAEENSSSGEEYEKNLLNSIRKEIATNQAEQEIEKQQADAMNARIHAVNMSSGHKGIPLDIQRNSGDGNELLYREIMSDVGAYSRQLQRLILEMLSSRKAGGVIRHRPYGRSLEIRDVYRPDGLCYSGKKLPEDLPDMAISVLVDNSGSMCGERISTAVTAAVLLYDFATSIGIPVSVAGHTASGSGVSYITFADFEQVGNKDRYRICDMKPLSCNRDGMAINIAADLLAGRPEEVKLLFIISDGQPNHTDYGGEEAAKDIQSIIRRYRNHGVEIIAAGIGEDRDLIRPIYGDSYLDIADLKKLPKAAAGLVQKRVMEALI